MAWLSDSTTDARDRVTQASVPYVRVDGQVIWDDWDDILQPKPDGDPAVNPARAANGGGVGSAYAWTGTAGPDGANTGTKTGEGWCGDWTSNSGSATWGWAGTNPNINWSSYHSNTCTAYYGLYCFEK